MSISFTFFHKVVFIVGFTSVAIGFQYRGFQQGQRLINPYGRSLFPAYTISPGFDTIQQPQPNGNGILMDNFWGLRSPRSFSNYRSSLGNTDGTVSYRRRYRRAKSLPISVVDNDLDIMMQPTQQGRFLSWLFGRPGYSRHPDYSSLEAAAGVYPFHHGGYPSPPMIMEECEEVYDPYTHEVFEECVEVH